MEIKDINLSVERLEEVRGGQVIRSASLGFQVGGNVAASNASSYGIGNTTQSSVAQYAPQQFSQSTGIHAVEVDSHVTTIDSSMLDLGFPYLRGM